MNEGIFPEKAIKNHLNTPSATLESNGATRNTSEPANKKIEFFSSGGRGWGRSGGSKLKLDENAHAKSFK